MDTIYRLIAAVAVTQNGNITRRQLRELGLSPDGIDRRIHNGLLHRVFPGVYHVGAPASTPLERAAAAVLACGERGVLSGGSAMTHWGFWKRWEQPFEVALLSGDRRPRGIRVHRPKALAARDTVKHHSIRTTRPARTLFDIAPRLTEKALARAVNNALHSPYLGRSHLAELLERQPSHPAAKRMMPFVVTPDGPTRSDWERAFPAFCQRYGLPRPLMDQRIFGLEVDAVWLEERLIVELDGWAFHNNRQSFETDRDRDVDMLVVRFETVRLTWDRMHERPEREAARLRVIVDQRRQEAQLLHWPTLPPSLGRRMR